MKNLLTTFLFSVLATLTYAQDIPYLQMVNLSGTSNEILVSDGLRFDKVTLGSDFNITGGTINLANGATSPWTVSGTNLYPTNTSLNVGIGTTAPTEKLHVNGNALISNLSGTGNRFIEATSTGVLQAATTPPLTVETDPIWISQRDSWYKRAEGNAHLETTSNGPVLYPSNDKSAVGGGWARSYDLFNTGATQKASFGALGNGTTMTYATFGITGNAASIHGETNAFRAYPTYPAWGTNKIYHAGDPQPNSVAGVWGEQAGGILYSKEGGATSISNAGAYFAGLAYASNSLLVLNNSAGTNTVKIETSGNSFFNGGNVGIGVTPTLGKFQVLGDNYFEGKTIIKYPGVLSINGGTALEIVYADPHVLNTLGTDRSTSNWVLGYAVRPTGAASEEYASTASNAAFQKGAFEVGRELRFKTAPASTVAIGTVVPLTTQFQVSNTGATTIRTLEGTGTRMVTASSTGVLSSGVDVSTIYSASNPQPTPSLQSVVTAGKSITGTGTELSLESNRISFNRNSTSYIDQLDDAGHIEFRMGSTFTGALMIRSDGDIGIGTSSPNERLHIVGGSIRMDNDNYLKVDNVAGGQIRMVGISSGNVAYVGPMDAGPTTMVYAPSSSITNSRWVTAGTESMRLTATGLGIGTTGPTEKLHVVGNQLLEGNLIIGANQIQNSSTNYLHWVAGNLESVSSNSSLVRFKNDSDGTIVSLTGSSTSWGMASGAASFTFDQASDEFRTFAGGGANYVFGKNGITIPEADVAHTLEDYQLSADATTGRLKWQNPDLLASDEVAMLSDTDPDHVLLTTATAISAVTRNVFVDGTAATTHNLSPASNFVDKYVTIMNVDAVFSITLDPFSTETIDGGNATIVLAPNEAITISNYTGSTDIKVISRN